MLIAEYYTWRTGPWALLQFHVIEDGRRTQSREEIVPKGKRAARTEALRQGAKPWNF
jgi:hypothetical protein